jgi:uncharacterized protein (TIGR02996 family)
VTGGVMTDYDTHPEFRALLDTVLARPADAAPRGILADWIEEHGGDAHAAFIRRQLAHPDWRVEWLATPLDDHGRAARAAVVRDAVRTRLKSWVGLASRARMAVGPEMEAMTRRGFVSEIYLPCAAFMRDAAALFSRHPVERVDLTDRRPDWSDLVGGWSFIGAGRWHRNPKWLPNFGAGHWGRSPHLLPEELLGARGQGPRMATLVSAAEARNWLSGRCVAYGRSLAGLPPLPPP